MGDINIIYYGKNKDILFFASELYILKKFLKQNRLTDTGTISQIKPNSGLVINPLSLEIVPFNLEKTETKFKFKQTCIEKLGVDNPMKSKVIQEKSKQTCMKKYGVDHNMKSPELLKKYQDIIFKKYGVHGYTQTHEYKEQTIQRKIKNNTLNIWGKYWKK